MRQKLVVRASSHGCCPIVWECDLVDVNESGGIVDEWLEEVLAVHLPVNGRQQEARTDIKVGSLLTTRAWKAWHVEEHLLLLDH